MIFVSLSLLTLINYNQDNGLIHFLKTFWVFFCILYSKIFTNYILFAHLLSFCYVFYYISHIYIYIHYIILKGILRIYENIPVVFDGFHLIITYSWAKYSSDFYFDMIKLYSLCLYIYVFFLFHHYIQ